MMQPFPSPETLLGVTRLLVMQATPFCNIDCSYCYLPDRDQRSRMDLAVVSQSVAWVYENRLAADDLSLVWHAGEPLVLSPAWYRAAIGAAAEVVPPGAKLKHCVQTNAMLVDDRWCDLFLEKSVQVGVSLDGPSDLHDSRRRTRGGAGTHAAAMRGLAALRRRGVPLHAICVVTDATLDRAGELIDFFAGEGIFELGLNIEEIEGANLHSSLSRPNVQERFRVFFERALDRAAVRGVMLREVRDVLAMLPRGTLSIRTGNDQNSPFANVTIAWDGSVYTFSPELAGLVHPRLGSLALGNVSSHTLADVLAGETFGALWAEVAEGVETCARTCSYFPLCRGGEPSNKLAELGSFSGTETLNCRLVHQQVAEAVLARLLRVARLKAPFKTSHRSRSAPT